MSVTDEKDKRSYALSGNTGDIKPGDRVWVDVLNSVGGEAKFTIPSLPAPSGTALLKKLEAAMNALTAYQVSEVLSSGTVTIHSMYSSDAPDRTTWTINNTSQTIWIGTTLYTREAPGMPWHQQASPVDTVPSFVWDFFRPLTNAHVIGQQVLDGVPTTKVASACSMPPFSNGATCTSSSTMRAFCATG